MRKMRGKNGRRHQVDIKERAFIRRLQPDSPENRSARRPSAIGKERIKNKSMEGVGVTVIFAILNIPYP